MPLWRRDTSGRGRDRLEGGRAEDDPRAFDGDELTEDDFETGGSDRSLLRMLIVIAGLGVLIAVLVLPPVSILDRDAPGIASRERKQLPALPPGLAARSSLFDLELPPGIEGPVTITVRMNADAVDESALSVYTYEQERWTRLGPAHVVSPGIAEVQVDNVPGDVAVLERMAPSKTLGLLLTAGQTPDPAAGNAGIIAVPGARPTLDAEGNPTVLEVNPVSVGPALASGRTVYLGTVIPTDGARPILDTLFGNQKLAELHAQRLVVAAIEVGADGVYVDYGNLDPALRSAFTKFTEQLATAAKARELGVIIGVPVTEAANGGAYDWRALASAADAVWVKGPESLDEYYPRLEEALKTARANGTAMEKLSLVVDRRSAERTPEGVRRVSLRDALATASDLRPRLGVAIAPGDAVAIEGSAIGGPRASGLRWDDNARSVVFQYEGRGGQRTVWLENRFSLAFRLDVAGRYGLGGAVVAGAAADDGLPEVWGTVAQFVAEGRTTLEQPYGPYLQPAWRASAGHIEGNGGLVTWRAPGEPGVYDITLVVSDGVVFVGQQISLRVDERAPAALAPSSGSAGTSPAVARR
ncbi:MAG: hypothetical protein IT299_04990 [Dehalococcoidia bacterium]|nr:hypothetical protein [Dehalococcoidia bacterium]